LGGLEFTLERRIYAATMWVLPGVIALKVMPELGVGEVAVRALDEEAELGSHWHCTISYQQALQLAQDAPDAAALAAALLALPAGRHVEQEEAPR
jgi:hypothetical protein